MDNGKVESKYEMVIYWNDEDQAFIVEVPELPGCMADGPTYQEAVSEAEKVIDMWIRRAQSLNRPVPEPKGRVEFV